MSHTIGPIDLAFTPFVGAYTKCAPVGVVTFAEKIRLWHRRPKRRSQQLTRQHCWRVLVGVGESHFPYILRPYFLNFSPPHPNRLDSLLRSEGLSPCSSHDSQHLMFAPAADHAMCAHPTPCATLHDMQSPCLLYAHTHTPYSHKHTTPGRPILTLTDTYGAIHAHFTTC